MSKRTGVSAAHAIKGIRTPASTIGVMEWEDIDPFLRAANRWANRHAAPKPRTKKAKKTQPVNADEHLRIDNANQVAADPLFATFLRTLDAVAQEVAPGAMAPSVFSTGVLPVDTQDRLKDWPRRCSVCTCIRPIHNRRLVRCERCDKWERRHARLRREDRQAYTRKKFAWLLSIVSDDVAVSDWFTTWPTFYER